MSTISLKEIDFKTISRSHAQQRLLNILHFMTKQEIYLNEFLVGGWLIEEAIR